MPLRPTPRSSVSWARWSGYEARLGLGSSTSSVDLAAAGSSYGTRVYREHVLQPEPPTRGENNFTRTY